MGRSGVGAIVEQRPAAYTFTAGRIDLEELAMKALIATLILGMLLLGCASPAGLAGADSGLDSARMNAIDREATRAGVRVYWINAPRKKVDG